MKKRNGNAVILFLLGLFSATQVQFIGSIAIAELYIFLAAPIFFVRDLPEMRRCGFLTGSMMIFLMIIGVSLSSIYNASPFYAFIRGFAHYYGLWASFIVAQHFLRKRISDFRWFALGGCFSSIITIFAFRRSIELQHAQMRVHDNDISVSDMANGPLFWIQRLSSFLNLPIIGWYLKVPFLYSIGATAFLAFFSITTSESGRAAALCTGGGLALMLLGRRSVAAIKRVGANLPMLIVLGLGFALIFKAAYSNMAVAGMLGEKARLKYESQTRQGTDALHLLMGGRPEVFAGCLAIKDSPLFGYGPWAIDDKGYWGEFIAKFGNQEDLEAYYKQRSAGKTILIPGHSHIIGCWIACGVLGVFAWIYFLYLCYDCLRRRIHAVPELYGWLAVMVPNMVWHICFSPFSSRVSTGFTFAILLTIRAIATKRIPYSWDT